MTKWLTAHDVAERLCVCEKTAHRLMRTMRYSVVNPHSRERQRIRVSEAELERWMNGTVTVSKATGDKKRRMPRREE